MPPYHQTVPHVIAASIALSVVDVVAVSLKFWVRWMHNQALMADDWLLIPATVRTPCNTNNQFVNNFDNDTDACG
jgi:hypothetical protein